MGAILNINVIIAKLDEKGSIMVDKHLIEDIKHVSLSLFNKNFFSVYHGSISARISASGFIINSKDTILDEVTEDSLVKLDCQKRDYYKAAKQDHKLIYHNWYV